MPVVGGGSGGGTCGAHGKREFSLCARGHVEKKGAWKTPPPMAAAAGRGGETPHLL